MKTLVLISLLLVFGHAQLRADTLKSSAEVFMDLEKAQKWVDKMPTGLYTNLPIGIKSKKGRMPYELALTGMSLTPQGVRFDLLIGVTLPFAKKPDNRLYFAVEDVEVNASGNFVAESMRLTLQHDVAIPFGDAFKLRFLGGKRGGDTSTTYIVIGCDGIESLRLHGELVFDPSVARLADDPDDKSGLKVQIDMELSQWGQSLISLDIPPFESPKLKDWKWTAQELILDLSDERNAPEMEFPKDYLSSDDPEAVALWQGLSIRKVALTLPQAFGSKEGARFEFQVSDLLCDERGLSLCVGMKNLFTMAEGRVGTWGFSMDTLGIELKANKLQTGLMKGELRMPFLKEPYAYKGKISDGDHYQFQVQFQDSIGMRLWGGSSLSLMPSSYVALEMDSGRLIAKVSLNGDLNLRELDGKLGDMMSFEGIRVRDLTFQTRKPYITVGEFAIDKPLSIQGFPIQVDELGLRAIDEDRCALFMDIGVSLSNISDGAFSGKCALEIISTMREDGNGIQWEKEKVNLTGINVAVDIAALSLTGSLNTFDANPTYGHGWSGSVKMKIKSIDLSVEAKALFGKKSTYRYWFADAMVNFGKVGIPIYPGLSIQGFGGGAYQRVRQLRKAVAGSQAMGFSTSGYVYVPDSTIHLGIRANTQIGMSSNPKIFNATVGLELAFSGAGGLAYLQFIGAGKALVSLPDNHFEKLKNTIEKVGFLTKKDQQAFAEEESQDAAIKALVDLKYDVSNRVFTGLIGATIESPFINGLAETEIYFGPDKWYWYIGRPDRRVQFKIGIGKSGIQTGAYLVAGSEIPAMPEPPEVMRKFIPVKDLRLLDAERGTEAIRQGKGFAFGANLSLQTGKTNFLCFYGDLEAGVGFDMMLKEFPYVRCDGGISNPGIDGWLAAGQAYSYLRGDVGITLKLFGLQRSFSVLDVGMAALLQAQVPAPSWFSGQVVGQFNILQGVIKGKLTLKFEIGERCNLAPATALEGFEMIADVLPGDQSTDVDVYACPSAAFNMSMDPFKMDDGRTYRIVLDHFRIENGKTNLKAQMAWGEEGRSVTLTPEEILPPHTSLLLNIKLRFEEETSSGWKPVIGSDGKPYSEQRQCKFTTGPWPERIPDHQRVYAYPLPTQQHYYPDESNKGYVRFKPQNAVLVRDAKLAVRLCSEHNDTIHSAATWQASTHTVEWVMPSLNAERTYRIQLLSKATEQAKIGQGIIHNSQTVSANEDHHVEYQSTKLNGLKAQNEDKVIHEWEFKVSPYARFDQRLNQIHLSEAERHHVLYEYRDQDWFINPDVYFLTAQMDQNQYFDPLEMQDLPNNAMQALVQTQALLSQDRYYQSHIYPWLYKDYDYQGMVRLERESDQSIEPSWAVRATYSEGRRFPWYYELPLIYHSDLTAIQTQLLWQRDHHGRSIRDYQSVFIKRFPLLTPGHYPVRFQYRMPDGSLGSAVTLIYRYQL